jgi:hypothetical protein
MPTLAKVTFSNRSGLAKDSVVNTFAFDVDATDNAKQLAVAAAITGFFDGNNALTSNNVIAYLSNCLLHDTPLVELYDLTGHLDGSPHGSPVFTAAPSWSQLGSVGTGSSVGNQLAACIIAHADYDVPEQGAAAAIPTSERAQDEGAPPTHTGIPRLRARERGRIMLGPVVSAIVPDTNFNPSFTAAATNTFMQASQTLMAAPVSWSVWSRRDSQLRHITHGWVDHGVKTMRKREYVPNVRTSW